MAATLSLKVTLHGFWPDAFSRCRLVLKRRTTSWWVHRGWIAILLLIMSGLILRIRQRQCLCAMRPYIARLGQHLIVLASYLFQVLLNALSILEQLFRCEFWVEVPLDNFDSFAAGGRTFRDSTCLSSICTSSLMTPHTGRRLRFPEVIFKTGSAQVLQVFVRAVWLHCVIRIVLVVVRFVRIRFNFGVQQ